MIALTPMRQTGVVRRSFPAGKSHVRTSAASRPRAGRPPVLTDGWPSAAPGPRAKLKTASCWPANSNAWPAAGPSSQSTDPARQPSRPPHRTADRPRACRFGRGPSTLDSRPHVQKSITEILHRWGSCAPTKPRILRLRWSKTFEYCAPTC